jgi:integrase
VAKAKITEAAIQRVEQGEQLFDTEVSGFGARRQKDGVSYFLKYTVQGRQRLITIGAARAGWKAATARKEALKLRGLIASGHDPREQRKSQPRNTFGAVIEQFLERHVRPNCSDGHARNTERILRREAWPRWSNWPITAIKRQHIMELLDSIKDRGAPIIANRTKAALSKLFRFAVERGYIETSPVLMISAPSRERPRERVLDDRELSALSVAADKLSPVFQCWFRFHIATGQRLNETAGLRWDEIDRDARLWVLPAERSKNGKAHSVPLSDLALAQITAMPRFSDYVFTTSGEGPIRPGDKIKRTLITASGVDGWTYHDIRRTVATWLESAGYSEKEIALVLNHQRAGVTSIYARADLLEKKREMLDAWATHLMALGVELEPEPALA